MDSNGDAFIIKKNTGSYIRRKKNYQNIKWKIGTKEIKQVQNYKYLGIEIQKNLIWSLFKNRLKAKAEKAMSAAWGMGLRGGSLSVKAAEGVWKALVSPILEYGAEIWGDKKWKDGAQIQKKMGKRILQLKKTTADEVVLGELGWWPLKARRDMLRLRYWRKILNMTEERLPKITYEWQRESGNESSWVKYTEKILEELGMQELWEKQKVVESKYEWDKKIEKIIHQREEISWKTRMLNKPKSRTYIKHKVKL